MAAIVVVAVRAVVVVAVVVVDCMQCNASFMALGVIAAAALVEDKQERFMTATMPATTNSNRALPMRSCARQGKCNREGARLATAKISPVNAAMSKM